MQHHVALSIVRTDRMPDNGSFRAKVAQEKLIVASGMPYTIVAWLAGHGVARARLHPVGRGEIEPVADNATADGRALNRRVTVAQRSEEKP